MQGSLDPAKISIHALREEGDPCLRGCSQPSHTFLSTPSARRATGASVILSHFSVDFYPRPPRGGRPGEEFEKLTAKAISIHALREEGDSLDPLHMVLRLISIHALREEGD